MVSYIKSLERDIQLQRIVTLTSLGTLLHWYCFYALSSILPYIFSTHLKLVDNSVYLMSWFAIVLGFFIRPIGTILLAPRIDLLGRKSVFNSSLNLLSLSVFIILFFPFNSAPVSISISMILISRLLQGVAISMEYGAAISYIYESVPQEKTGFFTGILQLTAPIGVLGSELMILVATQMVSEEVYHQWFWKFPLFFGMVLFFISNRIRSDLPESPVFELMKKRKELSTGPLREIFKSNVMKKDILFALFSITAAQGANFYLMHSFIRNYLSLAFSESKQFVVFFMIAIMSFSWPAAIFFAKQSDKSRPRNLFLKLLIANFILIPIFFTLFEISKIQGSRAWVVFIPIAILYMGSLSIYGVTGKLLADMFPPRLRGTAISIPYHIGNGIFGGLIPVFTSMTFQKKSDGPWFVLIYVCTLLLIAILINLFSIKRLKSRETI